MGKQTLLMILAGLVLAGPAWGEPFEDGKRAYLRGDDRQARVLLRQAVRERPRDPVRRDWLAKVYDRLLQPLEALIERDMAAKIRAGSGLRPTPPTRSRIQITQSDLVGLGPVRQSIHQPQSATVSSPAPVTAAPTSPSQRNEAKFMAAFEGTGGGFDLRVTALGADGEARLKMVRTVMVTLELGSGGTYLVALDGKSGLIEGQTMNLHHADSKISQEGGGTGQPVSKVKISVTYGEEQETLPTLDVANQGLYYHRRTTSGNVEPPNLPG